MEKRTKESDELNVRNARGLEALARRVEERFEQERERRHIFFNGVLTGIVVILWLRQIVQAFSTREE